VTASHAVQGARDIFIKISNGAAFPVDGVSALDSDADIAILKVSGQGLPTLKLADSDKTIVGEPVVTIGSPLGLENSVSTGIVSGIRRQGDHVTIQTTAPISPGSSGGPLLNEMGEVIGVTTSSVSAAQNINFATAINEVKKVREGFGARTDIEKAVQAYLTGVLYMNKQEYANAEKSLARATRLDPKNVDAWLDLGSVYYSLRQRDKEGDAYQKAVSLQPNNSQAHYLLGTWYEDVGQFERAVAEYRAAVKIDPTDDNAWFDLGELELLLGRRSAAAEAHERLKRLNQGLAMRLNRVIELSDKAGR
jgi:Flp pilus assembly protein TadD